MNTTDMNKNLTAPSVTIAPRNIGSPLGPRGVLTFVVTLTPFKDVRSYPCRSMESAIKLAERFIAGLSRRSLPEADVSRHSQATADVIKPRPAAPVGQSGSDPEATPAPAAEPVAA